VFNVSQRLVHNSKEDLQHAPTEEKRMWAHIEHTQFHSSKEKEKKQNGPAWSPFTSTLTSIDIS
jgi:hypothetical protein